MKVLVTGGAGYAGHRIVPYLMSHKHEIVVYDTMWFGEYFPNILKDAGLKLVKGDIRDTTKLQELMVIEQFDAVIHLACISNDPSFELDESLSRTINFEAFEPLVVAAKTAGIKRFINVSTSSVYGISDAPEVTEDHPHVPITLYNTFKSKCEPILFKYMDDDFICVNVRPSTHCGYSQRMRFDLSVNILTNLAISTGKIIVHGGAQLRPNIHVQDIARCYRVLLEANANLVQGETFNCGVQNMSIADLADLVAVVVAKEFNRDIEIEVHPIKDIRSYHVNSDKIKRVLGFTPKLTVEDAINDLCKAFKYGLFNDTMNNDEYYNVKQMRRVFPDLYKNAPPTVMDARKGIMSEIDLHRGIKHD